MSGRTRLAGVAHPDSLPLGPGTFELGTPAHTKKRLESPEESGSTLFCCMCEEVRVNKVHGTRKITVNTRVSYSVNMDHHAISRLMQNAKKCYAS